MFGKKKIKVLVEVSARHCHLSKEDLERLFGIGYTLGVAKQLSQPSDFACKETVDIILGYKKFEKVRVVGPTREQTQIEISLTDAFGSGVMPPVRLSGNLQESSGAVLVGPIGQIDLKEGLIIAQRHLHCSTEEAKKYKIKSGGIVSVKIEGARPVIFENVAVRTRDDYKLCLHLDTDEGNSAGINKIGEGFII
ncbi:MAG: phosphate propanoyltransferase [Candidatus Staskawiczbacteria bacterium]|nr:phosphate propanoyltransferase [Candidatus Staskawiczbacteria bacterium]